MALAGFEGRGLAITVPLSDRAARALAGFRGESLYLYVPRPSDEAVRALATFRGDSLSLAGLQEPPAELTRLLPEFACKKLSLHPWEWNLGRNAPVTPADARLATAYAARLGKPCMLPGITGFETPDALAIAEILAASPASFAIPNLRRVSSKTLTVLIERGNIELPPLEFLELIPEPDGRLGDDFVIPDDFSLYLHAPTITDPGMAPAGGESFYVLSPVPHLGNAAIDWERVAEGYGDQILASLEPHLPGVRETSSTSSKPVPIRPIHRMRGR